jgi:hypothetical protein
MAMNWKRARQDRRRSQASAGAPSKLSRDRGKPASAAQLDYLAALANKLGRTTPDVTTAYQARIEIDRLKQLVKAQR